jgi:hypothetical protein
MKESWRSCKIPIGNRAREFGKMGAAVYDCYTMNHTAGNVAFNAQFGIDSACNKRTITFETRFRSNEFSK